MVNEEVHGFAVTTDDGLDMNVEIDLLVDFCARMEVSSLMDSSMILKV